MRFSIPGILQGRVYTDGKVRLEYDRFGSIGCLMRSFDMLPDMVRKRIPFDNWPVKHKILHILEERDLTAAEIATQLGQKKQQVRKPLWYLRQEGKVARDRDKTVAGHPYRYSRRETT